ncbi:MAG: hypothetical protein AMXMBFR82_51250 [Candidatus Hydrogenedentota bacterium]
MVLDSEKATLIRSEEDSVFQAIDRGVRKGIRAAIMKHKRAGHPIVVLRDGKVVEIPSDEIPELDETGSKE